MVSDFLKKDIFLWQTSLRYCPPHVCQVFSSHLRLQVLLSLQVKLPDKQEVLTSARNKLHLIRSERSILDCQRASSWSGNVPGRRRGFLWEKHSPGQTWSWTAGTECQTPVVDVEKLFYCCCVCVDDFGNNPLVVDFDVDSPLLDGPQLEKTPRSSPLQEWTFLWECVYFSSSYEWGVRILLANCTSISSA